MSAYFTPPHRHDLAEDALDELGDPLPEEAGDAGDEGDEGS